MSTIRPRLRTLDPWVARYVTARVAQHRFVPDTAIRVRMILDHLSESFGARPLNKFTSRAVERWLAKHSAWSPATARQRLSAVRAFARWLVDVQHAIPGDPTRDIRIGKHRTVPRALRPEQVAALLETVPDQRGLAIVHLMVGMGLRAKEVATVEVGDYDRRRRTLIILHGKGEHQRELPVPVETARVIDAYIEGEGITYGPLIRSKSQPSAGLTALYVGTIVSGWMRDAGIKKAAHDGNSGHALRHTFASDVLDRSGNIVIVQEALGHADLNTTRVYLRHAGLEEMRTAMEGRVYERSG